VAAFATLLVSWVLMTSALATNKWSKCEGETNTMQRILVHWGHNGFSIHVGEDFTQSIKYDQVMEVARHLDSEQGEEMFLPLPTPFDSDYDPSKWQEIEAELHRQKNKRDMISLLLLSVNRLVPDIAYWFAQLLPIDLVVVCLLIPVLMVLMLAWDDVLYRYQYAAAAITGVFGCFVMMCYGYVMPLIDGYNTSLVCFRGTSFIVHCAGVAQFSVIFFLFTLPKTFKVSKFNIEWRYPIQRKLDIEQREKWDALKEEQLRKAEMQSDELGSTASAVSLGETARVKGSEDDSHSNVSGGDEIEMVPLVDSESIVLESLSRSGDENPAEQGTKRNLFGSKGLFKKIGGLFGDQGNGHDDIDIQSEESSTVSLGGTPRDTSPVHDVGDDVGYQHVDLLSADSGTDSVGLGKSDSAQLP